MFRIVFDPDLPVYATSAFPDGSVASGEQFDWKAKGLQPIDVLPLFRSGLLTHDVPADSQSVKFAASPGELVEVPPPTPPTTKQQARAQRR